MPLLILGGTADARILTEYLHEAGIPIVYSVAGLVRTPNIPCDVVSGGFTQFGGLTRFVQEREIQAILDITHPYAKKMSTTAVEVARTCKIPCWRFHRPSWQIQAGDDWHYVHDWPTLLPKLKNKKAIFLSAGQVDQDVINSLAENKGQTQILRTAVKPKIELPASAEWIKAIGPFSFDAEKALIKKYQIDAIISKNSGGQSTVAKLHVARELNIPVYMFERPTLPMADLEFSHYDDCKGHVLSTRHIFVSAE